MNGIKSRMGLEVDEGSTGFPVSAPSRAVFRFRREVEGGRNSWTFLSSPFFNFLASHGFILLLTAFFFVTGCQALPFGKKEEPVTDAAYFNSRVTLLVEQLVTNSTKRIRRAALLDYVNSDGRVSQFGIYLTDKTGEVAVSTKSFQVVSRGETLDSLTKNGIANDGKLDKASAQKLGESLGVDTVILGAIADLQKGSNVDIALKAIDTQAGSVVSAASIDMIRSKQVQSLLTSF